MENSYNTNVLDIWAAYLQHYPDSFLLGLSYTFPAMLIAAGVFLWKRDWVRTAVTYMTVEFLALLYVIGSPRVPVDVTYDLLNFNLGLIFLGALGLVFRYVTGLPMVSRPRRSHQASGWR
jgi:hypothetical protein